MSNAENTTTLRIRGESAAALLSLDHTQRYKDAGYRYLLTFNREFTKGTLQGIVAPGQIPFVTRRAAKAWLAGMENNQNRGRAVIDYKVISHSLVEL